MSDSTNENGLANWKTQLRKGFLELCVLNHLRARKFYGYDLVQELKKHDCLAMREGTIYPILARLQDEGLVTATVCPSSDGPPRKYFEITAAGLAALESMNRHWSQLVRAMDQASAIRKGENDASAG